MASNCQCQWSAWHLNIPLKVTILITMTTNHTPKFLLVLCPDPTHKGRGSGYTSPISWASASAEALQL